MLKFFLACTFLLTSLASFASPVEQTMTMKERLRLSLWVEGLESEDQPKASEPKKQVLPEELERPLRKL